MWKFGRDFERETAPKTEPITILQPSKELFEMGDKSPKKNDVKAPKKDIKEKRRDKQDKKAGKGLGA